MSEDYTLTEIAQKGGSQKFKTVIEYEQGKPRPFRFQWFNGTDRFLCWKYTREELLEMKDILDLMLEESE